MGRTASVPPRRLYGGHSVRSSQGSAPAARPFVVPDGRLPSRPGLRYGAATGRRPRKERMISPLVLDLDGPLLAGSERNYRCYSHILLGHGYEPEIGRASGGEGV